MAQRSLLRSEWRCDGLRRKRGSTSRIARKWLAVEIVASRGAAGCAPIGKRQNCRAKLVGFCRGWGGERGGVFLHGVVGSGGILRQDFWPFCLQRFKLLFAF